MAYHGVMRTLPLLFTAAALVGGGALALASADAATRRSQDARALENSALENSAQETPAQDGAAPAAAATEEVPKVTGRIEFEGDLPAAKDLEISAKAAEGCCPPGEEVDRSDLSLLIDDKRGIANVVVTVTVKGAKVELPKEPVEIDQKGCRFVPHVTVVPKGSKVAFLNSDTTSHNVHLVAVLNDPLNQTVLGGKSLEREFDEAERVKVTCDMHTWMNAWLVVTDATHWAVTDSTGAFSIAGLPAGEHEAKIWHEALGTKTIKITVAEDGSAAPVEVKMAKKKKKKRRRR